MSVAQAFSKKADVESHAFPEREDPQHANEVANGYAVGYAEGSGEIEAVANGSGESEAVVSGPGPAENMRSAMQELAAMAGTAESLTDVMQQNLAQIRTSLEL